MRVLEGKYFYKHIIIKMGNKIFINNYMNITKKFKDCKA